jgi:hypothetical protein
MEEIITMCIIALFVCILFSVVNQNQIMKQVSMEIERKRKIDNQKFLDILTQYQKYMNDFQKTSLEINKNERKKLEKYVKDTVVKESSLTDLLIKIPDEIRHNPKIILDEDIYNHVNKVMGLVSENLPKLEEKGFIKNQNIDKLINDIKSKDVFSTIGSNSVSEVKNEPYNSNFDNNYHSYSQNNQMFSEPYANSSELENYTFLQNAHVFNPNLKNSRPAENNGGNPYSYLGGKKI